MKQTIPCKKQEQQNTGFIENNIHGFRCQSLCRKYVVCGKKRSRCRQHTCRHTPQHADAHFLRIFFTEHKLRRQKKQHTGKQNAASDEKILLRRKINPVAVENVHI